MKFIQVKLSIRFISSEHVEFNMPNGSYTCLKRVDKTGAIWKLEKDGIYVRSEFAEAYGLAVVE